MANDIENKPFIPVDFGKGAIVALDTDSHGEPSHFAFIMPDGQVVPIDLTSEVQQNYFKELGDKLEAISSTDAQV